MKLFVSPPSETDWKIPPDLFISKLRERYPGVVVEDRSARPDGPSVQWEQQLSNGWVTGSLDRELNTFVIDGDIRDCAAVALWLRTLVPSEQELVFYDEAYSADGELRAGTTAGNLTAAFLT